MTESEAPARRLSPGAAGPPLVPRLSPARVRAAGPAIASALALAFPGRPVSGSDVRRAIWVARRSPAMPDREHLLILAEALRAAHPMGATAAHSIFRVLAAAGLLSKRIDWHGRVVWISPGR